MTGPSALAIPKQPIVPKTAKLLAAARKYPCVLCGREGFTVACHNNEAIYKGLGRKSPDYLVAFLCNEHHDLTDGRAGGLSKEAKRAMWNEAFVKTMHLLWRDGWVSVT